MTTAIGLFNSYSKLNLTDISVRAMNENMDLMTSLNQDQLLHGEAPDTGKIGQYGRSKQAKNPRFLKSTAGFSAYAVMKYAKNPLPGLGNVDLILTGMFRGGFKSFLNGIKVFIESSDNKMDKLIDMYGVEKIFGLAPDDHRTKFMTALRTSFFKLLHA